MYRQLRIGLVALNIAWIVLLSRAQANYLGTVLYPLTPPEGLGRQTFLGYYSTFGGQTVAFCFDSNGNTHAVLWSGPNASAVDLTPVDPDPANPPEITASFALGTNGMQQV